MIHQNIKEFEVLVEDKFLYNLDPNYEGKYTKGKVFGVSSYVGEVLTFQVWLENGAVFSYMPIHALKNPRIERGKTSLELSDLVYKNCPGSEIVVSEYEFLKGPVECYFKKKDLWMKGEYITTVDWHKDNEQFHLVALENGQYAALPNHKLKFKTDERLFPEYRKMRETWSVR